MQMKLLTEQDEIFTEDEQIKQFGYDLFAGSPLTFAPITDAPIPSDYIIGPGDTLNILFFGKKSMEISQQVNRDGYLNIPDLGPVSVAGLSFSELKENLLERIAKQMIGVKASISLGKLRSIRIFVLGNVYRPGSYTVSALSTLTNAIFSSGGVKRIGSLRDIQLKRKGKIITRFDLYDLLLKGDTGGDHRLLPGDVIFVPSIGMTAGIMGAVKLPAIYELKPSEQNLIQLIDMAGGTLPGAFLDNVIVKTFNSNHDHAMLSNQNRRASIFSVNVLTSKNKILLNNGDVVNIQHKFAKNGGSIKLGGLFKNPGTYTIVDGETLSSVIQRAGGLARNAYLEGAIFTRVKLKQLEQRRLNKSLDELERDMILSQGKTRAINTKRDVSAVRGIIDKMRQNQKPIGRMSFSLGTLLNGDTQFLVMNGDTLFIPDTPNEVTVIGEVNQPVSHLFNLDYGVDEYIANSGGMKKNADESQVYVVKANGMVILANNLERNTFFRQDTKNVGIEPGDTIVIPLDTESATSMEIWNSATQITSQLAITLASFKTLGLF
jgi:protein involved in polysaccharide export with SLBB domain